MKKCLLGLLLVGGVWGQVTPFNITLTQQPLPVIQGLGAQYVGQAGQTNYFYWVVGKYGVGNSSPSLPFLVPRIALAGGGSVTVSWQAPGVQTNYTMTYDVLRTTSVAGFSTCNNCLVASATSALSVVDTLGSLPSYTLNTYVAPETSVIGLDNVSTDRVTIYDKRTPGILHPMEPNIGSVLPTYCNVGQSFVLTGSTNYFICFAINVWTNISTGGGGGGNSLYPGTSINVKTYGAVGDNSHDDTAAFQAAAAAGQVYVPCGTFKITASINLNANSPTIIGDSGANNRCATLVDYSVGPTLVFHPPVQGSPGDFKLSARIANLTMFATKNAIELGNPVIPVAPGSYQNNLIVADISNVNVQGPYVQASDPNAYTAVVPTIASLVAFGVGINCTQCFGLSVHNSIVQQFGVGLYLGADESEIRGNRLTINGNSVIIYPAASGATNFTQGNNNVIRDNKLGANLRVGEVRLQNNVGSTKIQANYFENYCPSSTFLLSRQSYGTDYAFNEHDNPNNSTLCPQVSYVTNSTPLIDVDDVRDIFIHGNHMLENGNSVPGIAYANTYGNNFQYHVFDNGNGFPATVNANMITQGTSAITNFYVSSAGPALTGGTGNIFLGDSSINKAPGGAFLIGGAGTFNGGVTADHLYTTNNCSTTINPAACGNASAGSVAVLAAATSVTVNTTLVGTQSQIFVFFDSSLGARLGITCNTTVPAVYGVSSRVAGTSFTITSSAPTINAACFNYSVVN